MSKKLNLSFPLPSDEPVKLSESDTYLTVLLVLAQAQFHNNGPITMTQLREAVKSLMPLSPEDMEPLKNRGDFKFDQVLRNLISNGTLERLGLADYDREKRLLSITDKGRGELFSAFVKMFPNPLPAPTAKDLPEIAPTKAETKSSVSKKTSPAR